MLLNVLLIVVLLVCAATDITKRKIYNIVIFPALMAAFVVHFMLDGWANLGAALAGFFVGIGILLIPYLLGGMGAGDVKLLGLVGAIKGTVFVFHTAFYMAVLGAIMALGVLFFRRHALQRMKALLYGFLAFKNGYRIPFLIDKESLTTAYPYGVAISAGALLCLFLNGG
ncbi:MAG TPA: prepilin peptidase [Bacillales bacterium]|nr:prepilin peptidase [Bacillales bacterium]